MREGQGVISNEERAAADLECAIAQYADIDEDGESPLGGAIFQAKFGFTVEDVLDEGEDMAKNVATAINHLNYPDDEGRVYCRARNAITEIGAADCFNCPLYYGSMQGMGVECMYSDMVSDNINVMALTVTDPAAQTAWMAGLISKKQIPADPLE
jgi:hypothetical protein